MNDLDPRRAGLAGRVEADWLVVDQDDSGGGRKLAGDDSHQSRLSGTVLADQGQNFARTERKRDIIDGRERAERMADVLDANGGHGWRGWERPSPAAEGWPSL